MSLAPIRPAVDHEPIAVGLELWTVRHLLDKDPERTLARVRAAGIAEIGCTYTVGPVAGNARLNKQLDAVARCGMCCISVYLDTTLEYQAQFDAASTLGAKYVVIDCSPGLCEAAPSTLDAIKSASDSLAALGERCRRQGLQLTYHPHWWEFRPSGQMRAMELLLEQTDPALLALELDLGWANAGGIDSAAWLHRYRGRIPIVHVKDRDPGRGGAFGGQFVTLGKGKIDYDTLIPIARATGVVHYNLEVDAPDDAMASVTDGVAWFKQRPWL